MPASLKTIIGWLVDAKTADANFLIVAGDRYNNGEEDPGSDYPVRVWAKTSNDVHQKIHSVMGDGDAIREVYDLRADLKAQLLVNRAYFVPRGTPAEGPLPHPPSVDEIVMGAQPTQQNRGVTARATVKPRSRVATVIKPVDPEAAKTELEAALEEGAGSLTSRFLRGIKDGDDD